MAWHARRRCCFALCCTYSGARLLGAERPTSGGGAGTPSAARHESAAEASACFTVRCQSPWCCCCGVSGASDSETGWPVHRRTVARNSRPWSGLRCCATTYCGAPQLRFWHNSLRCTLGQQDVSRPVAGGAHRHLQCTNQLVKSRRATPLVGMRRIHQEGEGELSSFICGIASVCGIGYESTGRALADDFV